MEGDEGIVGHYHDEIGPGEDVFGVPYEELAAHRGGVVEVGDDGAYEITDGAEPPAAD
jgi:hypothetical protein